MGVVEPENLRDVERVHILKILRTYKGNRTDAAQALGVSRSTLYRKLKEYEDAGEAVPTEAERASEA